MKLVYSIGNDAWNKRATIVLLNTVLIASLVMSSYSLAHLPSPKTDTYTNVRMECVSEFNWNQLQETTFKSASGFFVANASDIVWQPDAHPDCAGGWSALGNTLTMYGAVQPRMFFKDEHDNVITIDMRKDVVSWTQDVSQLGNNMNGALYATWVPPKYLDNAPLAATYYCDANDGTGNNLWCPEMDLGESNVCGFRTTSHPVVDLNAAADVKKSWTNNPVTCSFPVAAHIGRYHDGSAWKTNYDKSNLLFCAYGVPGAITNRTQSWCDHYGNAVYHTSAAAHGGNVWSDHVASWELSQGLQNANPTRSCTGDSTTLCSYGPAPSHIDSTKPYNVQVSFNWEDDKLISFTSTLSQYGKESSITRSTSKNPANVDVSNAFPADGKMGLLAQLWSSPDMSWLAGRECSATNPSQTLPDQSKVQYTISNIKITRDGVSNTFIFATHRRGPSRRLLPSDSTNTVHQ